MIDIRTFFICLFCFSMSYAHAEDPLDRVSDALTFSMFHNKLRTRISGLADIEGYHFDQPASGVIDTTKDSLFNPRLTLFLDIQAGEHVYGFAQARIDRGFDPSDRGVQARLDEYAVRFTPWQDGRLNVQAGQFATVVGNWVPRHLSWENPFVTAPLPYEHITAISDTEVPQTVSEFIGFSAAEKYEHNPVIWGPSYATGVSVAGRYEKFDYAMEMKNAGLASRPESWSIANTGFEHPAFSARLGYRPDMRWNLGLSASAGPYYRSEAAQELPIGRGIGDFEQYLLGQDVSFEWHHVQVWAEVYESRFEVPNIGNVDTVAYYIEGKLKFTPQFFGALRWNQQFFSTISDNMGQNLQWGDNLWRIDSALGYRFTAHSQLKLQYSLQYAAGRSRDFSNLMAGQFTLRF
jgi:hypothetical protein